MKRLLPISGFLLFLIITLSISCQNTIPAIIPGKTATQPTNTLVLTSIPPSLNPSNLPSTFPSSTGQELIVSFMDVGQADCTIVQYGNSTMIIDAGGNATALSLVAYLKKMNIIKFDYVIGTHPHEDHIGGLDAVIKNFEIGKIYMPKVSNNTQTFEDVLVAIKSKNLSVTTPISGAKFSLGDEVQCLILAPNSSSYEELNSYSIVFKMTFEGKSFIFTGDAEVDSEREILSKGFDLRGDILKVGHHGSSSSTSSNFLEAVSPSLAVIFVGKDNTYGHPHQSTINNLKATGVKILRTDLNGTITMKVIDGQLDITAEE